MFDARWFSWLDRTPDAFFDPPVFSLAYLLRGFPSAPVFTIIDVVGLTALCAMTLGYRTRLSTVVALLTYVVSSTFSYSHGKISHQIAIALVLLCMTVADWGRASPRRVAQGLSLLAGSICFGFAGAGLDKARHWLTPDTGVSGILSWYYPRMDLDEPRLLAPFVSGTPLALLKLADFTAVLMELSGFVMLLLGRIPWCAWLLSLPAFHLANTLILNITFPTQIIAYLAFVNFAVVSAGWAGRPSHQRVRAIIGGTVVAATVWHIVTRLVGDGSFYFLGGSPAEMAVMDFIVGIGACDVAVGLIGRDLLTELAARKSRG